MKQAARFRVPEAEGLSNATATLLADLARDSEELLMPVTIVALAFHVDDRDSSIARSVEVPLRTWA